MFISQLWTKGTKKLSSKRQSIIQVSPPPILTNSGSTPPRASFTESFTGLPEDVLYCVARHLNIGELLKLSLVCKQFHICLSTRSVWHKVIKDILTFVPNPGTQYQLTSNLNVDLRALAIDIDRAHNNIRTSLAEIHTVHGDLSNYWLAVTLLPGGKYYAAVSRISEISLFDVRTGRAVKKHIFAPPHTQCAGAKLHVFLCVVQPLDLRIVISVTMIRGSSAHAFWVLDADLKHLSFTPILHVDLDEDIALYSAQDDCLVYTWGLRLNTMFAIRGIPTRERAMRLDDQTESRFVLSGEIRNEPLAGIQLISDKMLCVVTHWRVCLFHLPDTQTHGNTIVHELTPIFCSQLNGHGTKFHASPVIDLGNDLRVLNFLAHGYLHSLFASPDPTQCRVIQGEAFIPDAIHATIGCLWSIRIVPSTTNPEHLTLIAEMTPASRTYFAETANARLPDGFTHNNRYTTFRINIPNGVPLPVNIKSVSFDEWSGKILIHFQNPYGAITTVLDLQRSTTVKEDLTKFMLEYTS